MIWFKRLLWTALILIVVIQVFRPSRTNPTADPKYDISAAMTVPSDVAGLFSRSCNDCHSNGTVWPRYSEIAPVSWLVAFDVNHGRRALNFSEWGMRSPDKNSEMLGEICKEVTEKEMPGMIYPLMHSGARLSDADIQAICRWTQSAQKGPAATESQNGR